jgi:hypothetical protein
LGHLRLFVMKTELLTTHSLKPNGTSTGTLSVTTAHTMDADLNHQPEEISKLVQVAVETGADIVVGFRRVEQSIVINRPERLLLDHNVRAGPFSFAGNGGSTRSAAAGAWALTKGS